MTDISESVDISKSVEESANAFNKTVGAIDQLVRLPTKAKDSYRKLLLDNVVSKVNERLYGRYELIHAVENFGEMRGPEEDLAEIVQTARDRAKYLHRFNKYIEKKLVTTDPRIAANLVIMTRESIKYYEKLATIEDVDRMASLAPKLAEGLKEIADYLESVNSRLKEKISGP